MDFTLSSGLLITLYSDTVLLTCTFAVIHIANCKKKIRVRILIPSYTCPVIFETL